ncbi:ZPR1 zinc finger domain-containing protein [Candidatus Woesearchaeota archaeon]|nr:ZPR1 zinc finger domain-containing protein [Candidatus Woesearchaeota archaeon]
MSSENVMEEGEIDAEPCPVCKEKKLILTEREEEIPYFGKVYLFSMTCAGCKFHKADVESMEEKEPVKYTFEISSEEDMKIRVVKSSQATIKIPHVATIEPGIAAQGFVTNIEGILNRVKYQLESVKDDGEDDDAEKKARTLIKKLNRVIWGQEKLKMIIEDPTGNSAIISEKANIERLKK